MEPVQGLLANLAASAIELLVGFRLFDVLWSDAAAREREIKTAELLSPALASIRSLLAALIKHLYARGAWVRQGEDGALLQSRASWRQLRRRLRGRMKLLAPHIDVNQIIQLETIIQLMGRIEMLVSEPDMEVLVSECVKLSDELSRWEGGFAGLDPHVSGRIAREASRAIHGLREHTTGGPGALPMASGLALIGVDGRVLAGSAVESRRRSRPSLFGRIWMAAARHRIIYESGPSEMRSIQVAPSGSAVAVCGYSMHLFCPWPVVWGTQDLPPLKRKVYAECGMSLPRSPKLDLHELPAWAGLLENAEAVYFSPTGKHLAVAYGGLSSERGVLGPDAFSIYDADKLRRISDADLARRGWIGGRGGYYHASFSPRGDACAVADGSRVQVIRINEGCVPQSVGSCETEGAARLCAYALGGDCLVGASLVHKPNGMNDGRRFVWVVEWFRAGDGPGEERRVARWESPEFPSDGASEALRTPLHIAVDSSGRSVAILCGRGADVCEVLVWCHQENAWDCAMQRTLRGHAGGITFVDEWGAFACATGSEVVSISPRTRRPERRISLSNRALGLLGYDRATATLYVESGEGLLTAWALR